MIRIQSFKSDRFYRLAIAGLLLLSVTTLGVTIFVMVDFLREQVIVQELIQRLPPDATASAEELAGELRWQFRLTILVLLNLVVTGVAMLLLSRAYSSSQESLRDIKALADDILDSMDEAIVTTDRDGIVTRINRRGTEMLGTSNDDLGRPLSQLATTIPLESLRLESHSSHPGSLTRDYSTGEDGAGRIIRVECQTLNDHAQTRIGNIIELRDITERALMEDRLRRMERYAGLGSMAAGLHHEIKNPLSGLSLHVQLLEEQLGETKISEEAEEMFGVIKSEVHRIGQVLEGFRDFASTGQLSIAEVDIARMIRRQVQLIAPRAAQQQVTVKIDLPAHPLPLVGGDCVRLEQVLLNLMVNAMEAMPGGGELTIRARQQDQSVHITVIDTGSGVPEDLQKSIFDPYFTTKSEGSGLGLALCDKIVRQHQGRIELQSHSHGSAFDIALPLNRDLLPADG